MSLFTKSVGKLKHNFNSIVLSPYFGDSFHYSRLKVAIGIRISLEIPILTWKSHGILEVIFILPHIAGWPRSYAVWVPWSKEIQRKQETFRDNSSRYLKLINGR